MLVPDHSMMGNCCPGLFPHFPPSSTATTRQQDIKTVAVMDTNCVSKLESTRDRWEDNEAAAEDVSCDCENSRSHFSCCPCRTKMSTHSRETQTLISFPTCLDLEEKIMQAPGAEPGQCECERPQVKRRQKFTEPDIRAVSDEDDINEEEIRFYQDISKYIHDDVDGREKITNTNIKRNSRRWTFNWKRLSGLDNINDEKFKSELRRRLDAKSRANVIGWQIISAKSAPKNKTTSRRFVHSYTPVLDGSVKTEIYRRNLPLGVPTSIKTLDYDSDRVHDRLVTSKDAPLKIHADPVKKTGLLETRDGSLRRSYQSLSHLILSAAVLSGLIRSSGRAWCQGGQTLIRTAWPRWTRSTSEGPWVKKKNSSIITFPTEDISELTNLDSLITPSKETFPNIQKLQTLIWRPGNQRLSFLIS